MVLATRNLLQEEDGERKAYNVGNCAYMVLFCPYKGELSSHQGVFTLRAL